jgi:hypothetical protein
MGDWVGLRAELDAMEKGKILPLLGIEPHPTMNRNHAYNKIRRRMDFGSTCYCSVQNCYHHVYFPAGTQ